MSLSFPAILRTYPGVMSTSAFSASMSKPHSVKSLSSATSLWLFFQPINCRRFTRNSSINMNTELRAWSCRPTRPVPVFPRVGMNTHSYFHLQRNRRTLCNFSTVSTVSHSKEPPLANSPPVVIPEKDGRTSGVALNSESTSKRVSTGTDKLAESPTRAQNHAQPTKTRSRLRPSKAAISLTPAAISRLRALLSGPTPQLIRIGVRNKGCAGMSYHLDYVESPDKFDEIVEQDGVKVLIDSKALFSIIGSEMDWKEDKLSSKFAFKNPNIKDACGCGESFNI